jgi:hypothetical protein
MKQHLVFWLLVVGGFSGSSFARAQDTIRYLDRKSMKETIATGTIEQEDPGQIAYRSGTTGSAREIPATDIVDVVYEVPGAVKLTYRGAGNEEKKASDPSLGDAERRKTLTEALRSYEEVLSGLQNARRIARRHVEFKIARLLARQAEDDPAQGEAALAALIKFNKEHADGWQISQSARLLARLQLARGDAEGAEKTYEELAAVPKLPEETRQECDLLAAEALILGKKCNLAERKLQELLKSAPAESPRAIKIRICLAECLGASGKLPEAAAQLQAQINATTDRGLKARGYNALGDCYRLAGRSRDALWPYLWVDVTYHQDKDEHIKAMEQLAKLFEEQGDKARAKQYRDRLKKENN